ncbi:MAG: D-2-hydroxyacid dehydrogenase [Bacillota bacterium]|nr:D-2-hydroxyacid dehydrogenase [Bacillota bacterium]
MRIISTIQLSDNILEKIKEMGDYFYIPRAELSKENVQDVDICIGNVPVTLVPEMKNIKWLQLDSAGSDQYAKLLPPEAILTNGSGTFGASIAEHILMVVLMAFRNMPFYSVSKPMHRYQRIIQNRLIQSSTFLILGTGDLGSEFAKRVKLLGGKTIGLKRVPVDFLENFDTIDTLDHLEKYLDQADVVVLTLPNHPSTTHIINKGTLSKMRKDTVLVNVGRGNAINENDLYQALVNQEIACACLDVFEKEPLAQDSPLWDLENVIITPHVAGNYANTVTFELFYKIVEENIQHYIRKEPMRNLVNRNWGY